MFQHYSSTRRPPPHRRRSLVLAVSLALIVACQSDSEKGSNAGSKANSLLLPADDEILSKVYASGPRTPPGFYQDPRLRDDGAATVHHIDSVGVLDPASAAAANTMPFELCTDDVAEALAWSETEQLYRAVSGDLIVTGETARYYEFTRTLTDVPDWLSHARVFKCTYLDRSAADARSVDGPAGRLNATPLDGARLQSASEYLWTFSRFNNEAHVVLDSVTRESGPGWRHTLTLATLTPGAGAEPGCDLVEVRDWELSLDAASGELTWVLRPVKTIAARLKDGRPQRCG